MHTQHQNQTEIHAAGLKCVKQHSRNRATDSYQQHQCVRMEHFEYHVLGLAEAIEKLHAPGHRKEEEEEEERRRAVQAQVPARGDPRSRSPT